MLTWTEYGFSPSCQEGGSIANSFDPSFIMAKLLSHLLFQPSYISWYFTTRSFMFCICILL